MESWIVYALISSITAGVGGFLQKIQSEEKSASNEAYIFYIFVYNFIAAIFGITFFGNGLIISIENMLYGFLIVLAFNFVVRYRIKSLDFVSSSTYFINYRIFSSILLVILGQIIFGEIISLKEYIGVFLGFFIFYLLFEKKEKGELNTDFKKGIIYIFYCVFFVSIVQILAKNYMVSGFDPYSLMFFQGLFGTIIAFTTNIKKGFKNITYVPGKRANLLFILNGVFLYISALFNNLAFQAGDLAVVYKILSYSIFIPIMLSVIFYKEKVTLKKLIAFVLTIISIALFI